MSSEDFKKAQLINQVAKMYRTELGDLMLTMYLKALKEYAAAEVEQALQSFFANTDSGQFMPKPADIIKQLTGGTQTQALLAWSKVDWAVRCIGTNASVCFEDLLIHQVIMEMGGWVSVGSKNNEEWPFTKNEFEKRYRGYLASTLPQVFPERLIGTHDHTNGLNGVSEIDLKFISCETRLAIEKRQRDQANQPAFKKHHHLEAQGHGCTLPISQIKFCANEL